MHTNVTTTAAPAPRQPEPFPGRSSMYYCTTCEACSTRRLLLWALDSERPDLTPDERRYEAETETEDLDCHCEHTTAACAFFDADEHDDTDCGTCNYVDEDHWCNR